MWLAALLYAVVVAWAFIQITPGLPGTWAHPFWSLVPDAEPLISADPGQGRHMIMRLLTYGMIFWIMVRTCVSGRRAAWMLRAIALWSTGLAVYGIYAYTTGVNPILGELLTRDVLQASFVNRNNYATYAVFGALANIAAYLDSASGADRETDDWRGFLRDILERFFGGSWIYAVGALICIGPFL